MNKFRKKAVVIEAMQFERLDRIYGSLSSAREIEKWSGGIAYPEHFHPKDGWCAVMTVRTPEGPMRANPEDWIIRDVRGEYYPCKPDIFRETYESAP